MKTLMLPFVVLLAVMSANLFCVASTSEKENIILECECFDDKGGWSIDSQFIDEMGSSYLIAHGLGKPVDNAQTKFKISKSTLYNIFFFPLLCKIEQLGR